MLKILGAHPHEKVRQMSLFDDSGLNSACPHNLTQLAFTALTFGQYLTSKEMN
jgi:hypothetical protein